MNLSFTDFLKAYGEANPPALRRKTGEDISVWRAKLLNKVRELLAPLPKRVPSSYQIVETIEESDHARHLINIAVNEFSILPSYLLIPKDVKENEKRPGILALHGHAEYGMDSLCGTKGMDEEDNNRRAYALSAVRSGYITMSPAWWGWSGRDGDKNKIGNRDKCNVNQMAAGMYGLSVIGLHMQDAEAALDVLANHPNVDANRLGCTGNSYGGRTGMWFGMLDQRIKVMALGGCMNTFRERSLKLSSCAVQYPEGILAYADVPELFSLFAPRFLHLQAGTKDKLLNAKDIRFIDDVVKDAYRDVEASENYEHFLHNDGHILLWEAALAFFKKHL